MGGPVHATGFFAEQAIDARAADAEPTGNHRRAEFLLPAKPKNLAGIDGDPVDRRDLSSRHPVLHPGADTNKL